jgi:seryl-tRNA synthetase
LIFDKEFNKKAIQRIDELQQAMIEKSKTISGADEYVQKKMKLFNEDEALRKRMKEISFQEKNITHDFLEKSI